MRPASRAPAAPLEGRPDPNAFICQRLARNSRHLYAEAHRDLDRLLLPLVLGHTGGNQQRAALLLGIARRTLRMRLRDLELHVTHSVEADDDILP
jgi:DNA-binding NtrC family response regulator